MQDAIIALVVLGTLTIAIVSIINAVTSYKLKRKLIEKAQADEKSGAMLSESMKLLAAKSESNKYPTLKWGLVTLGAGLGLILTHYLSFDYDSPLPFGLLLTCISIGFLLYYFIMKAEEKK
jgi:hypothetical protein